jgi:hypothetical protein
LAKKSRTGFMTTFDQMQKVIRKNPRSNDITSYLQTLTSDALTYLSNNADLVDLTSLVTGKEYFAYSIKEAKSRAINKALYRDISLVTKFLDLLRLDEVRGNISSEDITSACYTIVMSLACYIDLTNKGDRQTPGTFFEYLITHILTRHLKSDPSTRVKVDIGDDKVSLTMDLILAVNDGKIKYHIAVKNSTRERASEIWAHQRILDKAFGDNTYTGLFIGLSETKLDHKSNEVTEICVPEQWRAYQQFISNLYAIYYVDIPRAYKNLHQKPPHIVVKQIGEFYYDILKE